MKNRQWALAVWWGLFVTGAPGVVAGSPALVDGFTPQGTVKGISQVKAHFNEDMVAFGDPRLASPFVITCPAQGKGRWVDTRNWVFDFEKELPAGVRCQFSLKEGLQSLAGNPVVGEKAYAFSTGGPAIEQSRPYDGSEDIVEDQAFLLVLDSAVNESSVLDHLSFSVEGVQERIGSRLLSEKVVRQLKRQAYLSESDKNIIAVQARRPFPPKAKVSLVWGKGILSTSGVPTEADQVLHFAVRPPFRGTFSCERERKDADCIPLTPLRVSFTAPVASKEARRFHLKDAAGKSYPAKADGEDDGYARGIVFQGPFPEKATLQLSLSGEVEDDYGRPMENRKEFPLAIRTDAYPPLAKFSARFGILEAGGASLPVSVRGLEPEVRSRLLGGKGELTRVKDYLGGGQGRKWKLPAGELGDIVFWMRRVESARRNHSVFSSGKGVAAKSAEVELFRLPAMEEAKPLQVVGIPLPGPGFYVVEMESQALGNALLKKPGPMFVATSVLVTNLGVHFKWGRESSLVWVTSLDSAKPVPDAVVEVRDCRGKVLAEARTDASGVAPLKDLPLRNDVASCYASRGYSPLNAGLFVTAKAGDDMAFVHSSWDNGIESWRFQVPTEYQPHPVLAHTVFDRSLVRAGDTIHMKHWIRRHTMEGFGALPGSELPKTVVIEHEGSGQKYELPLHWSGGAAESDWPIPKDAKLGEYSVRLVSETKKFHDTFHSGSFRVEEFRVPLMKAVVQGPKKPQIAVSQVPVDVGISYLSGGPASGLPVKLRGRVSPRGAWPVEGFDEYVFMNGGVKEGRTHTSSEDEESSDREDKSRKIGPIELTLDRAGTGKATLKGLPSLETPFDLFTELQYSDPNGEIQTAATTVPVFPSGTLVGIKNESLTPDKAELKPTVAVTDLQGKPVAGAHVSVELFEKKTYSHRRRIVGGYYAYDHYDEVKKVGGLCEGTTDARGLFFCEGKAPRTGNLLLQASTKDADGRRAVANTDVWIRGEDQQWFSVEDHDRMDVIPEAKRYEPGQSAKFQVRMPFREATALITVEREGIMDVFVRPLSGKAPVVEIPVKPNYAPNVYVSVLAVRGRVGDVHPTALVDLGKPAFKLGLAGINVGWRAHELDVKVTPARKIFRVREKARVHVSVRRPDGSPAKGEIALAAVDEGLLQLLPNESWRILDAMMGKRAYAVETSTAQMQVVGKRHFGLKALPSGGGGGSQTTRELFDTLLLWKARVPLNAQGEADVDVPLNDSVTGFRIVAIASEGLGRFGTGETSVRTTQDLMILPGLPTLVREGDTERAHFTLRNTTSSPMTVALDAEVQGLGRALPRLSVRLQPSEAKEVGWDLTVPAGLSSLTFLVKAKAESGQQDRLRLSQKVVPAVPVRAFQATVLQLDRTARIPVALPKDALPGRGGVRVAFHRSLLDGLSGVREYMRTYPFSCLEQEVSRAVSLRDEKLWAKLVAKLPSYQDGDGLLKYFPTISEGSDSLTAYVLSISDEAGWKIPEKILQKMRTGLTQFVSGAIVRGSAMPTADLTLRKLSALEALSRNPKEKIDGRQLAALSVQPNLWPTSAVLDWFSLLKREPGIPERESRRREAEGILRSRLQLEGTTMGFSTARSDALWWLMISEDTNVVRMLLSVVDEPSWKEDVPRLVKGALGRQNHGHWDLTDANAWGVLALEKFARAFETTPVSGASDASLGSDHQVVEWKATPKGTDLSFSWPARAEDLRLEHKGAGRPWVDLLSLAAIPLKEPLWAGYRIEKTIQPISQERSGEWTRGDVARVRLKLRASTDMTWVVVSDPIPGGAAILGTGLGNDSQLDTQGERQEGVAWPSYEERSYEAFRTYYSWVPTGQWTAEYTLRLNNGGTFSLPPTRVEAMYAPETFGELPNAVWKVKE